MAESESLLAVMDDITEDTAEFFTENSNGELAARVKGDWVPFPYQDFVDDDGNAQIDRLVDHIRSLEKP
jgi:hypothetical protein